MKTDIKVETMADKRVYQFSTKLFEIGLRIWNRMSVNGVENVPDKGGVLIASNHASFLDPPALGASYRVRPIHFMARDTLWDASKFGKWWLTKVGCIPVARGTGDSRALKLAIRALKAEQVVSVFPEGTRTEDGELQEAKGGVGFIVKKSGCSVVPIYIDGSYNAFPKNAKFIKPAKVKLLYGNPIMPEEFEALGDGREAYDKIASLIMERIAELKKEFQ